MNTAEIVAAFAGQDAVIITGLVIVGKVALRAVDRVRLVSPPKAAQQPEVAAQPPVDLDARRAS